MHERVWFPARRAASSSRVAARTPERAKTVALPNNLLSPPGSGKILSRWIARQHREPVHCRGPCSSKIEPRRKRTPAGRVIQEIGADPRLSFGAIWLPEAARAVDFAAHLRARSRGPLKLIPELRCAAFILRTWVPFISCRPGNTFFGAIHRPCPAGLHNFPTPRQEKTIEDGSTV